MSTVRSPEPGSGAIRMNASFAFLPGGVASAVGAIANSIKAATIPASFTPALPITQQRLVPLSPSVKGFPRYSGNENALCCEQGVVAGGGRVGIRAAVVDLDLAHGPDRPLGFLDRTGQEGVGGREQCAVGADLRVGIACAWDVELKWRRDGRGLGPTAVAVGDLKG